MNVYRIIQEFPIYVDRKIVAEHEINAMSYFIRTSDYRGEEFTCLLHTNSVEIADFPDWARKKTGHKERLEAVYDV